jgi:tRNA modification GTPase
LRVNTLATCLTSAGAGALATLALCGPSAWRIVQTLFRPARGPLPALPTEGGPLFGTFGAGVGDEVIVCVTDPMPVIEVHCHGGPQVVEWLLEQCGQHGATRVAWTDFPFAPGWRRRLLALLSRATTTLTARILLDQYHGAELRAWATIAAAPEAQAGAQLANLARWAAVVPRLTEPLRVVVAGAPNAGKSSLLNALAGYQRSIVAPTPGTTRDVVTVGLALAGWPVELSDTAGLRATTDALEAAGTEQARAALAAADVVVWLHDASAPPQPPDAQAADQLAARHAAGQPTLFVATKADLPAAWPIPSTWPQVSATTGHGIAELATQLPRLVIPVDPPPGTAVPVLYPTEATQWWADWQADGRRPNPP